MPATFKDFKLRPELYAALEEAGYDQPTPIQEQAIPELLAGHDLIGIAQTGTGKTLAFLLPMMTGFTQDQPDPQGLVICPTRELAIQVAGEAERFGAGMGVRVVLAYGGTSIGAQQQALAAGVDLVVGTPGRLLDLLRQARLSFRRLRTVVLDEADRMLDMGFINDVDAILRRAPMSRQTLLFSATFPDEIRRLSERYMFHPATIKVGGSGTQVVDTVEHALYPVHGSQKNDLLREILRRERPAKALIFTATREATSEVGLMLRRDGHEVVSLSSLLSQANRERALGAFRRGEFTMLVATDVAARGLDITDIDLVVNYDVPMQPEDYVHRIGRTGRAERSGKAVTLITPEDGRRVGDIERLLKQPVERVTLDGFKYREADFSSRRRRGRANGRRRRGGSVAASGRRGHDGKSRSGRGRRRPGGGGRGGRKGSA